MAATQTASSSWPKAPSRAAQKVGGGLRNDGTATLTNSTSSGNSASGNPNSEGGGVDNYRVAVNLTNSTISGNTTPIGGGASNRFGQMFFRSSIITANAAIIAGGVESASGSSTVRSDTVLIRTLVSGNLSPKGVEVYQASGGVTTANYFNLFGHGGLTTAQALGGSGQFLSGSRMIIPLPCTAHSRLSAHAY
jgi:hypothetical protein